MKLKKEELEAVKELQQRKLSVKNELASIGETKLNIKMREDKLETFYSQTVDMEKEVMGDIREKYGDGNIDLETGEFTPTEK